MVILAEKMNSNICTYLNVVRNRYNMHNLATYFIVDPFLANKISSLDNSSTIASPALGRGS